METNLINLMPANRKTIDLPGLQRVQKMLEIKSKYKYQADKIRNKLLYDLDNIIIEKKGEGAIPFYIHKYLLTVCNYGGFKRASFVVDLKLISINSKNNAGRYKALNFNNDVLEKIIKLFAKANAASHLRLLKAHNKKIAGFTSPINLPN